MHVSVLGSGPRLVLVHGSITNSATWGPQQELADAYTLVVPDRTGYWPNPPVQRIDFVEQAADVADLLEEGDHLVGFSYGGVVGLLAAARRPRALETLTVIEPPCFGVARRVPAVAAVVEEMQRLWASLPLPPAEFVRRFAAVFGEAGRVPADVPPEREQGVRALMAERGPWEAEIPLAELGTAGFRSLVCSSGGHPAFESVCDVLERRLGAERLVLPGGGHAVHHAPGFNARFREFLRR
jgi:pimeloyl-ACP methyl ester carboxylesterase